MKKLLILLFVSFSFQGNSQTIDVQHYQFELTLNDDNDTIDAQASIRFILIRSADSIVFDLTSPQKNGKGMKVSSIVLTRQQNRQLGFRQYGEKLTLISSGIKIGDTASILITYKGIPSDGLIISRNKFGDRTFFGDNWPNRAHHWIPCNDRPDDKASFEFMVHAPAKYRVISNGHLMEEHMIDAQTRQTHWSESTPLPTKVMVIGAARFAVTQFEQQINHLPVTAWLYPQDSTKGVYDFATAPDIIQFFSAYIAPFPYEKLANVQSTTIFGGMENASCIFYAENLVTGDRRHEDVVAHEIAHQWFGDMVSEKSFAHLWLSEGFATYFTDLWTEHTYGKDSMARRMQGERRRVVDFASRTNHSVVDSTDNLMSLLNDNSYKKGGWILHMLRMEVGDSVFRKIIQTYYNQYKGSNAETRDFETVVERVTNKNWKGFFDQWFYQPGIPQLSINRKIDKDELKLTITQRGIVYRFPLEIAIKKTDGSTQRRSLMINQRETELKIKSKNIQSVMIDPDTKLLYTER